MRFVCNPLQENCYVVSDGTKDAVIIDCGAYYPDEKAKICEYIKENELSVKHLLVTHDHFDHVFGNEFIKDTFGLSPFDRNNTSVSFGTHSIEIIPAPGHSPEGVVYYCKDENLAFTGDTLFKRSFGRTDLDGGDYNTLMATLHKLTVMLPGDTQLLPGHGEHTFMDEESEWIKSY